VSFNGAEAVIVSDTFSGTITTVNDDNGFFPTLIANTSTFTGTFSYNSEAIAKSTSSTTMGIYDAMSFTLNLGGIYNFVPTSPEVQISNEYGYFKLDRFAIIEEDEVTSSSRVFDYIYFYLTVAFNDDLYNDTTLPSSVVYSDFGGAKGFILSNDSPIGYNRTQTSFQIFGEITSVTPDIPVGAPEPATLLLLGLGLIGLAGVRRKIQG
jgi:hypothetical protein